MSNTQSRSRAGQIRLVLILVLVMLAVLTVYQFYASQPTYQVQVFSTSGGWGYDILNDKQLIIHQPTIPGQAGMVGFASQTQALKVGERVVERLKETKALPTLTNDELRQLGVKIP